MIFTSELELEYERNKRKELLAMQKQIANNYKDKF